MTVDETGVARGEWLRRSRRAVGRSVERLADETGIDGAMLFRWEAFEAEVPDHVFAYLRRFFQHIGPTATTGKPDGVEIVGACFVVTTSAGYMVTPRKAGDGQRRMFRLTEREAALRYARCPVRRDDPGAATPTITRPVRRPARTLTE